MKSYYTCIILLTVSSMLIMQASIHYNVALDEERKQPTRILAAFVVLAALCEWGGVMLDGTAPALIPLHVAVKVVEFSLTPFLGVLYGHSMLQNSKAERVGMIIAMLHAVVEVLLSFSGWIILVDAENVYHHGPYYAIYTLACVASIAFFLVSGLAAFRRYQHSGGVLIWAVTLFLVAGVLVQSVNSSLRTTWLTVGISTIMLYKFYSDIIQQVDGLTELINRWGYDNYISRFKGKGAILFFDVDAFKTVNDTYGHAVGDECLKTVADCLRKAYADSGKCFRVGGDEFCVILEQNTEKIGELTNDFIREVVAKRKQEPRLPRVSVGYVLFDTRVRNINDAIAAADAEMYKAKETGRKQCTPAH